MREMTREQVKWFCAGQLQALWCAKAEGVDVAESTVAVIAGVYDLPYDEVEKLNAEVKALLESPEWLAMARGKLGTDGVITG